MSKKSNLCSKFTWSFFLCLALCLGSRLEAQEKLQKERFLLFSVFNSGTQLPGNIFTLPIHPGATVGMEFAHNRNPVNRWFQTAKVGILYHQYSQTAVQVFTEGGYRRSIWQGFSVELRLGVGYLHSFTDVPIFKLGPDGNYNQVSRLGRPQFMASSALGIGHTFLNAKHPWRLQLDYQFYLQTPFINEYVPLLPVNALHLGCAIPVSVLKRNK